MNTSGDRTSDIYAVISSGPPTVIQNKYGEGFKRLTATPFLSYFGSFKSNFSIKSLVLKLS